MPRPRLPSPPDLTDATNPDLAALALLAEAIRTRLHALQRARDAGLATVEVAIITAVLVGLAVALLATIAVAVRRRQEQIQ